MIMKRFTSRTLLKLAAACSIFAAGTAVSQAQDNYPTKPIELIVPFAAGGAGDGSGRIFAQHLSQELGQPVVVINRPGGNTIPATLSVLKAAPDGYTLLWDGPATSSIQLSESNLPYDVMERYFGPRTNISPYYIATSPQSAFNTLDDVVQAMKTDPRKVRVAWLGGVSMTDTVLLGFLDVIGVSKDDITLVPFTGSGPAATALAGNHIDLALGAIPAVLPLYQAGNVQVLALAGDQRLDALPDVPSSKEAGYYVPLVGWNSIGGPAGIPDAVTAKIEAAVEKIVKSEAFANDIAKFSYIPVYMTPEENRQAVVEEGEMLAKVRGSN